MNQVLIVLRTEHRYRRLLSASILSGIGDWFNSVALLSLLLHLTGSGLAVGITLAMRTFPYLIMGPIGGILADRMNRKVILIVSDFSRAVIVLGFLFIHSSSQVWIAYTATGGLVVFSALFSPARSAVIPQLVRPDHVMVANSLEESTSGLVMTLGSLVGGVATAIYGVHVAFLINSLSFVLSGVICWSIRLTGADVSTQSNDTADDAIMKHPVIEPRLSFWQVARQSRLIQVVCLQMILWPMGGGVINVLISVYGFQFFHSGNQGVGILYGALGVGFLISGFIAHYLVRWIRHMTVMGTVVEGLSHMCFSQSPSLWPAAFFLVLATIGGGIGNASMATLIMQNVPKQIHGRLFALFNTASNVTMALSMMLTGFLLTSVSARTLGFTAGTLIVCTSLLTGVVLLRIKLPTAAPRETSLVD